MILGRIFGLKFSDCSLDMYESNTWYKWVRHCNDIIDTRFASLFWRFCFVLFVFPSFKINFYSAYRKFLTNRLRLFLVISKLILPQIFGPKTEKERRWRKLHNDDFCNLCSTYRIFLVSWIIGEETCSRRGCYGKSVSVGTYMWTYICLLNTVSLLLYVCSRHVRIFLRNERVVNAEKQYLLEETENGNFTYDTMSSRKQ
jgi:hypothetical protein